MSVYYLYWCVVDEQIKFTVKNVSQQNKHCNTQPNKQIINNKLFYRNQMHYNYKSDENIFKMLIKKKYTPNWS